MLHVRLAIAATVAVNLATPAQSAPRPHESWGRAGVDFATYRQDAEECGRIAYYADMSDNEHAQAFATGTRRLEAIDGLPLDYLSLARAYAQVNESMRTERRLRELRDSLQSIVDICLTDRGYVKFALTEEQRGELGRLRTGSPERHHYLHALASDPGVLAEQAVPAADS